MSLRTALLLLCLAAAVPAGSPARAQSQPRPRRPESWCCQPCELHQALDLTLIQAKCGHLRGAREPRRAAADGRSRLRVAVVPAISTRKRPDPLFVLAGGPGMAATSFYTSVAPVFERIHRDRDIVLVDQRGTGGSNALDCESSEEDLYREHDRGDRRRDRALPEDAGVRTPTYGSTPRASPYRTSTGCARLWAMTGSISTDRPTARSSRSSICAAFPTGSAASSSMASCRRSWRSAPRARSMRKPRCRASLPAACEQPACHARFGDPAADLPPGARRARRPIRCGSI